LHVNSSAAPSPNSLRRHWELDEAPAHYYQDTEGTPEYDRRKAVRRIYRSSTLDDSDRGFQIYDRDPVRTIHLGAFIKARLQEVEATCGPAVFQAQYLAKAEPAVLEQIQTELTRV